MSVKFKRNDNKNDFQTLSQTTPTLASLLSLEEEEEVPKEKKES